MQEPQNKQSGNQGGLSWNEPVKKAAPTPVSPVTPSQPVKKVSATPSPADEQKNNAVTVVGVLAAAVIVGSLGAWALSAMKGSDKVAMTDGATTTTKTTKGTGALTATGSPTEMNTMTETHSSLVIAPTQTAGLQVMVTDAAATQPTWVVVYENNNGTPGNALGAGLFFPGSESGAIELLRGTIAGRTYFVGQSIDDGDKVFSLQSDKRVTDENGNPVLLQFQTN